MSIGGDFSVGTNINRMLDALGMPDAYGDKIGAMVDLSRGDMAGFHRNVVDLASGLSTGQMDKMAGMRGTSPFSRGFIPRCHFSGPHLHRHGSTYAVHQRVGRQAHIGQSYKLGGFAGRLGIKGRISGRQYMGSMFKPVRLGKSGYLFRGRMYKNMGAIMKDVRDGKVDGLATQRFRRGGFCRSPFLTRLPHMMNAAFQPGLNIGNTLKNIFGAGQGMLGGVPPQQANGGSEGPSGSSSNILSNPNLSLEEKLMLLMAKLAKDMDKEIQEKMGQLDKASGKKAGGKKGGGGILGGFGKMLGGIGKMAGGIAGTAFGGPLGGMLGSTAGGMAGNLLGGVLGGGGGGGAQGAQGGGGADGKGGMAKSDKQQLQTELQMLMQRRQQMFQAVQNMLKSLHDTSMSAVRNLKA